MKEETLSITLTARAQFLRIFERIALAAVISGPLAREVQRTLADRYWLQ